MIKDIESGLINCVITKDLSRLGRNYLDCGLYLEVFFPEHNVRYIAVNDGVDTLNKSAMDITPFRNILNEMYAADISVKIKSAYRARFQQGKFMGTTAPYGYIKDPADHNHLLIDDKVAHVVKEIFDLALKGNGVAKICRHLNKQHILRPAAYAAERGETGFERHFEGNEDKRYIWSGNSVRSILRSPIYAGNLVGYKRIAANMKSKKRPSKLPEEWEVIPNTHEGIVTQEEFDIVQQLITSRRLPQNKGGFVNIFAGVIKCVDCGCALRAMNVHRRKRPEIIDCVQYSCNNYARNECSAHNIEARDLFNAVLADINCFADMAVNDEKAVRAIEKRLTETDQSRAKALEKERKKLNKRLAELDRLFSSLYEDKVMERITERNFEMMSGKYQKEQLEIEARLKEVTETLNESYEKSRGIRDFLALIRNYQGLKELDAKAEGAAETCAEQEKMVEVQKLREKYEAAMEDDFNTADAVSAIFELVKLANSTADASSTKSYISCLLKEIEQLCDVLGIITERKAEVLDSEIEEMIAARQQARKDRNFALADEIRGKLLDMGIVLEDTREGVKWKRA